MKSFKNDVSVASGLALRGIKIFLSDKMSVFFSLLAPIIILMLYVLFLGDIQYDSLKSVMEGLPVDEGVLHAVIDGWMIAGVVSVSCIRFRVLHYRDVHFPEPFGQGPRKRNNRGHPFRARETLGHRRFLYDL